MENDYISRADLMALVESEYWKYRDEYRATEILEDIEKFPPADVRPVVYCKDCKFSYEDVGGRCCSHGVCVDCIVEDDFFCADGERREGSADG